MNIKQNTATLEAILEQVNSLPNTSTGITETWVFTLEDGSAVTKEVTVG